MIGEEHTCARIIWDLLWVVVEVECNPDANSLCGQILTNIPRPRSAAAGADCHSFRELTSVMALQRQCLLQEMLCYRKCSELMISLLGPRTDAALLWGCRKPPYDLQAQ